MNSCQAYGEDLPSDGSYVECELCKTGPHFECTTRKADSWRTMTRKKKTDWKCPECRAKEPNLRRNNSNASLASVVSEFDSRDKYISFSSFDKLISSKFKEITTKIDEKFKQYESSLEFQSTTIENLNGTLKILQKKSIAMEGRQSKMEKQNDELRSKIELLKRNVYQSERNVCQNKQNVCQSGQDGNKCKLKITEMPPNGDQEASTMVNVMPLGESSGYKEDNVMKPGSTSQPKGLVVALRDQQTNHPILENVGKDKPNMKSNKLCHQDRPAENIFYDAELKKDENYEYLWVRNGHILFILMKETQKCNTFCIRK